MKNTLVYIKNSSFMYDNNEYSFDEIIDKKLYFKRIKIIILEEMLYIQNFMVDLKVKNIHEFACEKIKDIFPQNGEILYDYEKSNDNNSIIVYSIKGKRKVEHLCKKSVSLEVQPVQFVLKNALKKCVKTSSGTIKAIARFFDFYYYIKCSNGIFDDNFISKNISEIYKYIQDKNEIGIIYIDKSCDCIEDEYLSEKMEIIKMNIMELVNEVL